MSSFISPLLAELDIGYRNTTQTLTLRYKDQTNAHYVIVTLYLTFTTKISTCFESLSVIIR